MSSLLFGTITTLGMLVAAGSEPPEWYDPAKKSWVDAGIRYLVVSSSPYVSEGEARSDVLEMARLAAAEFASKDSAAMANWKVPSWMISDRMLKQEYVEDTEFDFGPMKRVHWLLELSPENRKLMVNAWRAEAAQTQKRQLGGGAAFLFICLVSLVAYFKFDDATRGYYSKWLATGAGTLVATAALVLYKLVV